MRIAVISDVHSNLHALQAVLAAIDAEAVDEVWCLGDVVGYGPRPNECCALVRERASLCLAGNHDLGVIGTIDLALFAGEAGAAVRWTQAALSDDARGFLAGLEPSGRAAGVELYHASPRDPIWEYVLGPEQALAALAVTAAPLVLIGHSHIPLALSLEGMRLVGGSAAAGHEADLAEGRWLLNPGSVGQPRDGDPRAAWLLLDTGSQRASFRRVEYPVALTQAEMRAGGLPELLAARLTHGA
ncbi:MAG: metallophosphoesterase family protein [Actinobacteria bacterium]|nr:metallophosphoesterase family protein [Actinomycetota bacterium]